MAHRHSPTQLHRFLPAAVAVFAFVFGAGADCLGTSDPPDPPECTANCAIEAECGFRAEDECKETSCDAEGKPINDCERSANSCMMAIMARMAAYTGKTVKWDDAMNSKEQLGPDTYDLTRPLEAPAFTASTPPRACIPSTETSNSPAMIVSPSASAISPSEAKPCSVLKTSKSLSS